MVATRDLRFPVVIIAGYWNQAILNEPAWVAKHVLKLEDGAELEVRSIVFGDDARRRKKIWLYEGFGISCTGNRVEFFQSAEGSTEGLYAVMRSIVDLLPHTASKPTSCPSSSRNGRRNISSYR